MRERFIHRLIARVVWHANGGFTRVEYRLPTDREGFSRGWEEISTEAIPADLRTIGSRFYIIRRQIFSDEFTTAEELRQRLPDALSVERLENGSI